MKKTICRLCKWECHLLAEYDQNNNLSSVKIDPDKPSTWCLTGKNILGIVNNPARLRQPLQRCGSKGENKWRSISWDEAIGIITDKFAKTVKEFGRESLFTCVGFNKPLDNGMLERFANVLRLPNRVSSGNTCHQPRVIAYNHTFGFLPKNDLNEQTKNILLWGYNPANTTARLSVAINKAVQQGSRLIVVDPLETVHAKKAFKWLPVKPGTDLALILGMINLIIQENWHDRTFIEEHAVGFPELVESLPEYTLQKTAAITGLPQKDIYEVAKLFALEKPSIVLIGNALEQNTDCFQKNRAFTILTAITGNVDLSGGLLPEDAPSPRNLIKSGQLAARHLMGPLDWEKRLVNGRSQLSAFPNAGGQDIVKAICTQKPYPIKSGFIIGANPVMSWADSGSTSRALAKLDFLVISEFFLTPTAMVADIVLPAATYMETPGVSIDSDDNVYYVGPLINAGECKSNMAIVNSIGYAMGYKDYFWPDMESFWDALLTPYELNFKQLKEIGNFKNSLPLPVYQPGTYRRNGFPTQSAKIQLFSAKLAGEGVAPLPAYSSLVGDPDKYPYCYTNYKSIGYYHTAGRHIQAHRIKEDRAVAYINSDLAAKENILDGDAVIIETPVGRIVQYASLSRQVAPNTVVASHGWWYPEEETDPFNLRACINNLTSLDENIGQDIPAFSIRGLNCRVYKATSEVLE
ncbi:MAG: molybdopterin-dependent oxidoreductase [Syntrophomonas sp.]